ncbi:MAG: hypothetical protein ACNA7G_12690 [Methylobacter sp.]
MATSNRDDTGNPSSSGSAEVPRDFPNVPPSSPMIDHSFTLQAVMEMQRSIGQLTEAINQLGRSVDTLDNRTKSVEEEVSKVNTRLAIAAAILALLLVAGGYVIDKVWDSAWAFIAHQITNPPK